MEMDDKQFSDLIIGTAIVISALCAKAPQILQILENKSAEGINLQSVTLDLVSLTIYSSYLFHKEHPFTEWGDPAASGLGTFVLLLEVLYFEDRPTAAFILTISYVASTCALMSEQMPCEVVTVLECIMIPINFMSKLTQAYTNYQEGSTGQISAVTTMMMFCGSVIKTISIYNSTGDPVLIVNALTSVVGNGIIGMQIIYYSNLENTNFL